MSSQSMSFDKSDEELDTSVASTSTNKMYPIFNQPIENASIRIVNKRQKGVIWKFFTLGGDILLTISCTTIILLSVLPDCI